MMMFNDLKTLCHLSSQVKNIPLIKNWINIILNKIVLLGSSTVFINSTKVQTLFNLNSQRVSDL